MRLRLLPFTLIICYLCFFTDVVYSQTISAGTVSGTISNCLGAASSNSSIANFTVSGNNLNGGITATAPAGFEVAATANGAYGNSVSAVLVPINGVSSGSIYVRAALSGTVGLISGVIGINSAGASAESVSVSGTITPLPTVDAVPNQTVASGANTTAVNFTGTAPFFSWTNDNPAIGLAPSGSGNIPAFMAINTSNNIPLTANITVTPKQASYAYSANPNARTVSVIDMATNNVAAVINVSNKPQKTILSADGRFIYVIGSGGNGIDIIDTRTNTNVNAYPLPSGFFVYNAVLSPDGKVLAVGSDAQTLFLNAETGMVMGTANAGSDVQSIFSSDGNRFFAASYFKNTVSIINLANVYSVDATFNVSRPSTPLLTPDGSKIYVSETMGSRLHEINLIDNSTTSFPVDANPVFLSLVPDGSRLYITSGSVAFISVFNTVTKSVTQKIPVSGTASFTTLSNNGNLLYVFRYNANNLVIINTLTNNAINTVPLSFTPGRAAVNNNGSHILIPNGTGLSVFDTGNNTIIASVTTTNNAYINATSFRDNTGCDGTPTTFTITVEPQPPTITAIGSISGLTTTYGTPSVSGSFLLSGINLQGGLKVVPPPGFEVSHDNINFTPATTYANQTVTNERVYIRLAGTTNAATYTGFVELTSLNATTVYVPIGNSIVNPMPFTISGSWVKTYGDVLTPTETKYYNTPGFNFNSSELKNGNTFNSMDLTFTIGTAATDAAGVYRGALIISNFTGRNGYLASNYVITYNPLDLLIASAPITISANKVTKPYGSTLTNTTGNTGYTITGLKNNETIDRVSLSYGAGSAASAAPGVYTGTVVPSLATGGTFTPSNYIITYVNGNIEVSPPSPPVFTITGAPQAVSTEYGTASAASSFTVSAVNLTTPVTITAPDGFVVGLSPTNFAKSITFGAPGSLSPTIIYICLAAQTNVGTYTGDIAISGSPTTSTLIMPLSMVTPAILRLTVNNQNKTYGDVLTDGPSASNLIITSGSLKNGNTITGANYVFGQGKVATANVGNYSNAISVSSITGGNGFLATNYQIFTTTGNINVVPANLDIIPGGSTRVYGTVFTANQTFTATGLKNNETVTSVGYSYAGGTLSTSDVGSYTITPANATGTFVASNYNVNYIPGTLNVTPAPLIIKVVNTSKDFGAANPLFTATYNGFVNNQDQSQLTTLPTFSTLANTTTNAGTYPIIASGASALNYSISYVNGSLTILPPKQLVIPNTFTPNNDGVNDTWKIPALASYPNCFVQVFNRNGIIVHASTGYSTDWDGTSNGKQLPGGVYYYVIDARFAGMKASGYITIVR
ncbi:MAG: MBG domain-containing protein [Bacteroidota bacterium]